MELASGETVWVVQPRANRTAGKEDRSAATTRNFPVQTLPQCRCEHMLLLLAKHPLSTVQSTRRFVRCSAPQFSFTLSSTGINSSAPILRRDASYCGPPVRSRSPATGPARWAAQINQRADYQSARRLPTCPTSSQSVSLYFASLNNSRTTLRTCFSRFSSVLRRHRSAPQSLD